MLIYNFPVYYEVPSYSSSKRKTNELQEFEFRKSVTIAYTQDLYSPNEISIFLSVCWCPYSNILLTIILPLR